MKYLEDLSLQDIGLTSLKDIDTKFPNLVSLDVANNKILSVENIEYLS
jgi:Leucine-rich repeat (LRR) protein